MLDTTHDRVQGSTWPRAPFPGLRPFQVRKDGDESLIFYGRTTDKDEILKRLNTKQLVFVIGPSGCGKSSLVKAGVIPALEAGLLTHAGYKWRTAEMRPGQRPLWHLAGALARFRDDGKQDNAFVEQIYEVLRSDVNGLWLVTESLRPRSGDANPLLLLIDQFEEIYGSQVTSQEEVKRLLECIVRFYEKPHPNLYCIVTMRTDFLGLCANSPQLADVINDTLFMTPVLRHDELTLVTTLPPEDYHGEVDPELVKDIISDMPADVGYDPDHLPLMQHALLWLWHQAVADSGATHSPRPDEEPPAKPIKLTSQQYRRQGRLKGILNKHAEDIYRRLDPRGQQIAEAMFRRLSERDAENRYRRSPATVGTIRKLAGATPSELDKAVAVFAAPDVAFIERRPAPKKDDDLLDLGHESLIRQWRRLRGWADDEAEKVRGFKELGASASDWQRRGKPEDYLKSAGQLQFWQDWWRQHAPSPEWIRRYPKHLSEQLPLAREYLQESQLKFDETQRMIAEAQRRRIVRRFAMLAAAALVLSVIPAAFAVTIGYGKYQLELAKARVLASQAKQALDRDGASKALLITVAGLAGATQYIPELERVAYQSLQELREKQIFPSNGYFPASTFSPNKRALLVTNGSQLEFWDLESNRLIDSTPVPDFPSFIRPKWSDNGDWIILGSDGRTVLFAPCSRAELRPLFASCQGKTADLTRAIPGEGSDLSAWPSTLSPDGKFLLSGGFGVSPRLWDLSAPTLRERKVKDGPAGFAIAFNANGTLLAAGATDGTVRVYDTASLTEQYKFQASRMRVVGGAPAAAGSETAVVNTRRVPINVPVSSLSFHPKNQDLLLATTIDGTTRMWDFKTGTVLADKPMGSPGFISAAINAEGNRVAVTSEDGTVRVWAPETGEAFTLRGHRRSIWMVDFSHSDNRLVSASSDSTRIWSMQAALRATVVSGKNWDLPSASFKSANDQVTIRSKPGRAVTLSVGPTSPIVAAAATPDGKRALLAFQKGEIKLYDSAQPTEPIAVFQISQDKEIDWKAVGFMTGPDRVAAAASSGEIYTWLYFRNRQDLIKFAREQLPIERGQKVKLSDEERCRLGILEPAACELFYVASESSRSSL